MNILGLDEKDFELGSLCGGGGGGCPQITPPDCNSHGEKHTDHWVLLLSFGRFNSHKLFLCIFS